MTLQGYPEVNFSTPLDDDESVLEALRQHSVGMRGPASGADWQRQVRALYRRGISIETALQFLYHGHPGREEFRAWLLEHGRPHPAVPHPAACVDDGALSAAQWRFWNHHGYLVLPGVVPRTQCDAARKAIWDFLGASADDPGSWYREHPGKRGMMLDFYDHPALAANRTAPLVRRVCEQLYGSTAIYPSIDKVSFNPPENSGWPFQGSPLHWDASLSLPMPFRLQGLLYLGDCGPLDGAFHCVPGFHERLPGWLARVPAGIHPRDWALRDLEPVPVPGQAGDFILWHQALPHCATPNRGKLPRMVQYLTYLPDTIHHQAQWI